MLTGFIGDPLRLIKHLWPHVYNYRKQKEIITAVRDSDEVVVPAANEVGKDFVAGEVALSFMICPQAYFDAGYVAQIEKQRSKRNPSPHTCRVITTSVKDDHLRVLWGEIGRFLQTMSVDLTKAPVGEVGADGKKWWALPQLLVNHRDIRKLADPYGAGKVCQISYLRGMVSERGEGMAGHHAAYTLGVIDEASGVDNEVLDQMRTWAKKILIIGNPRTTISGGFFKQLVKGGDVLAKVR